MKRILLALFVVACGTTLSAQSTKVSLDKAVDTKSVANSSDAKQDKQIKNALLKDESIQDEVLKSFDSNKETNATLAAISKQTGGDKTAMIKQILGDKKLSTMAIDYVKNNPKLLEKAMNVVGM